jgi:hemoglobin
MNQMQQRVTQREWPRAELCTEEEVSRLVHSFYARIRQDEVLGPIFEAHIDDWDRHMVNLANFWSAVLRRTGRFSGAPIPKHAALPGLSAELFQRWLKLFRENAVAQLDRDMSELACATAERIAQSLWAGYQLSRDPDIVPTVLVHG